MAKIQGPKEGKGRIVIMKRNKKVGGRNYLDAGQKEIRWLTRVLGDETTELTRVYSSY